MILSYHAVPTEEEMFFISRPLHLTVVYEDEPDAGYIYYFGGAGRTMTLEDIEAGGRQTTEEN